MRGGLRLEESNIVCNWILTRGCFSKCCIHRTKREVILTQSVTENITSNGFCERCGFTAVGIEKSCWHRFPASQPVFSSFLFHGCWVVLKCIGSVWLSWGHPGQNGSAKCHVACGRSISMFTSGLCLHVQNTWDSLGCHLWSLDWKRRKCGKIRNLRWCGHVWRFNSLSCYQIACPVQDWQRRGRRVMVQNRRVTKMWQN